MRIFNNNKYFGRFIKSIIYYRTAGPKPRFSLFSANMHKLDWDKRIVEIVAYCLMPNHVHFLIKQVKDNGITEFMGKLSNSYTKYFNTKHKRIGPLLQGEFKSVLIESNEQLLHLSRYIHLNPLVGGIVESLDKYQWSSYMEFMKNEEIEICAKEIILNQFKATSEYKKFIMDQEAYGRELELIKHKLIDV